MADGIDIDLGPLIYALDHAPNAFYDGGKRAVQDILNDWQRESRDDAPIDTGELRRKIEKQLKANQSEIVGEISGNVYNNGFNYGYWQHNVRGDGGLKYIENNENREEWGIRISNEIKSELRKLGW